MVARKQLSLFPQDDAELVWVAIATPPQPLPPFMAIRLTPNADYILDLTQQIKRDTAILEESEILDHPEFFQERIALYRATIKDLI